MVNIHCPFCDTVNSVNIGHRIQNDVIYVNPSILPYRTSPSPEGFFVENCPKDNVTEHAIICSNPNCRHEFSIRILSTDPLDNRIKPKCRYFLNLLTGNGTIINKKTLIELVFDAGSYLFFKIFYLLTQLRENDKYKDNFILNLGSSAFALAIITLIPLVLINSTSTFFDIGFWIIFIFICIMITITVRYIKNIRKYIDNLPVNYHANYLNTNSYLVVKEIIKGRILGYPYKIFNYRTLLGLILFIPMIIWALYQSFIFDNLKILYLYMLIMIIFYLIFYDIFISFITMLTLRNILSSIPLKVNPLQQMGGMDIIGKLITSSLFILSPIFTIIGFLAIYYLKIYGTDSIINSAFIESHNSIYPYVFIIFYIIMMLLMFISPIPTIHKLMKDKKQQELDELLKKIPYDDIKNGNTIDYQKNQAILSVYDKINNADEWPFGNNFVSRIKDFVILVMIPILPIIIPIILYLLAGSTQNATMVQFIIADNQTSTFQNLSIQFNDQQITQPLLLISDTDEAYKVKLNNSSIIELNKNVIKAVIFLNNST